MLPLLREARPRRRAARRPRAGRRERDARARRDASRSPARSTPRWGWSARRVLALVLIGSGVFAWIRYGRDPVYLDDPSIHMAGPPPDLTPAAGAFVVNGGPSRRALTAAMLDLASRGEIAFRERVASCSGCARRSASRSTRRRRHRSRRPAGPATASGRSARPKTFAPTRAPDSSTGGRRLHRARRPARRSASVGPGVRQGARAGGRPQRLVPRAALEGHDALGGPRRHRRSSSASSRSSAA